MNYYLDITLLPDAEANLGFLWEKVYQQVHLALVENSFDTGECVNTIKDGAKVQVPVKETNIGISFPEYRTNKFPLGSKLRLLAPSEELLQQLDIAKWLDRLTDYAHFTSVREVPDSVNQFARFKRKRFDGNAERLARRRSKRKAEAFEQALKHYDGYEQQQTDLPFVNVKSLSEDQQFKLFIEREFVEQPKSGAFSCYGLSQQATVPWF